MAKIEGLNQKACKRRNYIAAKRYGVEATPIQFSNLQTVATYQSTLIDTVGSIPATQEDAIRLINSLSFGDTELTEDDVYIHTAIAANDNFIPGRFMFLDESTLRNIALGGESGVAFMNSHRTGGMSAPAELPYGRTIAGQYQAFIGEDGQLHKQAVLTFYMLRGVHPNGSAGPSTDDLNRMILSGSLFDVSVGVYGGQQVCDVCNNDLSSDDCDHVPGTTIGMTTGEVERQLTRGVDGGFASYTIRNAGLAELSAVFDGAVPGAGFRKALKFSNDGLDNDFKAQIDAAYSEFVSQDGALRTSLSEMLSDIISSTLVSRFGFKSQDTDDEIAVEPIRFAESIGSSDNSTSDHKGDDQVNEHLTAGNSTTSPGYSNSSTVTPTGFLEIVAGDPPVTQQEIEQLRLANEQLQAQLKRAQEEANLTRQEVFEILRKDKLKEFKLQASGKSDGGESPAWFGDPEKHAQFLFALHESTDFGPDSQFVEWYVELNRAFAEHLQTSAIFSVRGSKRSDEAGGSATSRLNKLASAYAKENECTFTEALARVSQDNPALYEQYKRENEVRD